MLTSATVCTSIHFQELRIAILFFLFGPDMPQFPPIVADIVMLILKNLILHVAILPDEIRFGIAVPVFPHDLKTVLIAYQALPAFFQLFIEFLDLRFVFSLSLYQFDSFPCAIRVRFLCSFRISSGEQLSFSRIVLLRSFLCFVSFRFRFSSITRRTFSIPSITNAGLKNLNPPSLFSGYRQDRRQVNAIRRN